MTNEEMILKAREAKSPDELLNMAHGAGMTTSPRRTRGYISTR